MRRAIWMALLCALLVFISCTNNSGSSNDSNSSDDIDLDSIAGPDPSLKSTILPESVQLTITHTDTTLSGESTLEWTFDRVTTPQSLDVYICAQEPGMPDSDSTYDNAGAFEAGGKTYYLSGDGVWHEDEITYSDTAADGRVAVSLPSARNGRWLFTYTGRRDGEVVTAAGATALFSDEPTLMLELNRPVVSRSNVVTAQLKVVSGDTPVNTTLYATITTPTGVRYHLPGFSTDVFPIYSGSGVNATYSVLNSAMSDFETGVYNVYAIMVDSDTGHIIA